MVEMCDVTLARVMCEIFDVGMKYTRDIVLILGIAFVQSKFGSIEQ